ncbi:MAG TPA: serpin family protein [Bacteroidales bacterium]|nr:serpin family protein [Bacteroidales bacterium]
MKKITTLLFILIAALGFSACEKSDVPRVKNPIEIDFPTSTTPITKVTLSEEQKSYVNSGNAFALKSLRSLYEKEKNSIIYSPLGLQFALAITANGASGETASEIIGTLGYGEDQEALNKYCNLLLNQLPALDKDVELKLTDAVIINEEFRAQDAFRKTAEKMYYAPVEYVNASNPKVVVDRINEWAYRSTNGFIFPFLQESDIKRDFVAAILNALYFKARWSGNRDIPMFNSELTKKAQPFYLDGGGESKVDYMVTSRHFRHGRVGNNGILELPYAGGKFAMYIILPDIKGGNGLEQLFSYITSEKLSEAISSISTTEAMVHLNLPKFEVENKYELTDMLKALGIRRAFNDDAQFDKLLYHPEIKNFNIGSVIQKARISVAEQGTEAAASTAVMIERTSSAGQPKMIEFFADHPFVYTIVEKSSGVMLFAGVYDGK